MNESSAPGTTTGQRGNGRPIPNANTLSFVLALVAVFFSLTYLAVVRPGQPPLLFGLDIVETIKGLPSLIGDGDVVSLLLTTFLYATPILLAVFLKVFGKTRRWVVLVPLALPLLEDFLYLFTASLQDGPEYFFYWIPYYGKALLFEMVLYAATAGVALACALSRKPGRIAMVGFGCVAALGAIAMFAGQLPFGAMDEYDSSQAWYLSSFLRFAAILASATVFVVSCDRSGLTPLLTMSGSASARRGGTAQGAAGADTPSKGLDAIEEIRKLKVLLDAGAISAEEYDRKKKELLDISGT